LTINNGVLQLGASNVIPDGAGVGNVSVTGTLDMNGYSEGTNGLSGGGTITTGVAGMPTLTIGIITRSRHSTESSRTARGPWCLLKIGAEQLHLPATIPTRARPRSTPAHSD